MMADERQELLMAELAAAMARITPAMLELNNFHQVIERRDYKKVIKWLRTGFKDTGSKPDAPLYFGHNEVLMTGLEYAVWQEGRWGRDVPLYESRSPDLRMAAIFFVVGADPAHNACTG